MMQKNRISPKTDFCMLQQLRFDWQATCVENVLWVLKQSSISQYRTCKVADRNDAIQLNSISWIPNL